MTEKMDINKARELLKICKSPGVNLPSIWLEAHSFIEGYESRDAEVEELKNIVKELYERLTPPDIHTFCRSYKYCVCNPCKADWKREESK